MCSTAPFVLALAVATVGQVDWFESFPAHRVIGSVYYVGSKDLASYLITTAEGHILINSGFERTVPLIRKSVESLGFKMTDIKFLLASHAHSDHVAGHAAMQELTGAKVCVMRGDDEVIASGGQGQYFYAFNRWKPCKVDRVLKDGEEVKLGGVTLVARRTPGHTKGCTTWTWRTESGGKTYDVVVIGSPNVNPGFRLVDNKWYPDIADDFALTFEVLKKLPCDVFLGAHGGYYGMIEKYERAKRRPTQTRLWTRKATARSSHKRKRHTAKPSRRSVRKRRLSRPVKASASVGCSRPDHGFGRRSLESRRRLNSIVAWVKSAVRLASAAGAPPEMPVHHEREGVQRDELRRFNPRRGHCHAHASAARRPGCPAGFARPRSAARSLRDQRSVAPFYRQP